MNRMTLHKRVVIVTRGRGYTLVEMLAAMGALVMVFGVLGAVLVQGLDSAARTRAKHRAAASASMGVANAMNDIADSAVVTLCRSNRVRYRRPVVGTDHKYILVPRNETPGPFTFVAPGDEIEVYYIDGVLYRQRTKRADLTVDGSGNPVGVTLTPLDPPEVEVVAQGLSDAHFTYEGIDPATTTISPWDVDSVTIHLTSESSDGIRTARDTTTRSVKLRNHL